MEKSNFTRIFFAALAIALLLPLVSAQSIVSVTSYQLYTPANIPANLPTACYATVGCVETEWDFQGNPVAGGYNPMHQGFGTTAAFSTQPSLPICGTFQDACFGPFVTQGISSLQFLHEGVCGNNAAAQFGSNPAFNDMAFDVVVDCSQVMINGVNQPGLCMDGRCKTVLPDLMIAETNYGFLHTPTAVVNGTDVTFTAQLLNGGGSYATNVSTTLTIGGASQFAYTFNSPFSPPLSTPTYLIVTLSGFTPGNHFFLLATNSTSSVTESDYTNNGSQYYNFTV